MKAAWWCGPILSLALAAGPVYAAEPAVPEPGGEVAPVVEVASAAPEAAPVMLGLTPVLASGVTPQRRAPLSFPIALGLTYGLPVAIMTLGGMAAYALPSSPWVPTTLGVLFLGSLASGYVYAGDPGRGAWVILGEYGVLAASAVVAGIIAVAVTGGGQSAGFLIPVIGTPIVLGSWIAYNVWKVNDLHALIDRKNKEALEAQP